MVTHLFDTVCVAQDVTVYSRPVALAGKNAARVQVVVHVASSSGVANLEQSVDGSNWVVATGLSAPSAAPYVTWTSVTGLSGKWLRVTLKSLVGASVYSVNLNTVHI